jgi:hypothetical protein
MTRQPSQSNLLARFAIIAILYVAIWAAANWPALSQPWWVGDDFSIAVEYDPLHNYRHGRPLQNLVHGSLQFETGAAGETVNMAAHIIQGVFHCLAAASMAYLLSRRFADKWPFVAMLLFLLWPFNGEAILWRSAGSMPIAAFLSVLGVIAIDAGVSNGRKLLLGLGITLIAAAGLFHQLGAAAGLALLMAFVSTSRSERTGRLVWEIALTACGYAFGAALVLAITAAYSGDANRAEIATDAAAKLSYFWQLTSRHLLENLPTSVAALQVGLAIGLLCMALMTLFARKAALGQRLLRVAAMFALFVTPVLPVLLVGESPTSARIVYFAPLLLVTSVVLLFQYTSPSDETAHDESDSVMRRATDVRRRHIAHYGLVLLVGYLSVRYMVLAQMNAQDFVTVYSGDVAQLQQLEQNAGASTAGASSQIVVANPAGYLRTYDPYKIHFLNGDAKASVFHVPWSVGKFIEWQSSLTPVVDINVTNQCSSLCQLRAQDQPFYSESLPNSSITCVCP